MARGRPEDAFIALLRSVYHNARHNAARPSSETALCRHPSLGPSGRQDSCCGSPASIRSVGIRAYATSSTKKQKRREIAVLGGGITGLTAAHYLARHAENTHITLYEASNVLGGWVHGSKKRVGEGKDQEVLLQHGPRMLRSGRSSLKYDDLVLYDVLANLGLQHEIRHPKAVSDDRYIYYPDHLVKMPSQSLKPADIWRLIRSYLTEPLWDGAFRGLLNFIRWYNRTTKQQGLSARELSDAVEKDESVAQYLTAGQAEHRPIRNIVSGLLHGIYGGDAYRLSAKQTMLGSTWYNSRLPREDGEAWMAKKDFFLLCDILEGSNRNEIIQMAEASVEHNLLAFEDGLLTITNGLREDLEGLSNVTIKYGEAVASLGHENDQVLVSTEKTTPGQTARYDHVICTLFSKQLAEIVQPKGSLPSLAETHAVTIMVVNLWYRNPDLLARNHGFGYLVPVATPDNDECALGVLFDSDLETGSEAREPPGTKLTVMLGGHYWDDRARLPSEEAATRMARRVVARHLGIGEDEPVVSAARLCRDCLPQHFVGHGARMRGAHRELLAAFGGRLTVAGPSYTTVGIIPSMRAGHDAAMRVARGHGPPWYGSTTATTTTSSSPSEQEEDDDKIDSNNSKRKTRWSVIEERHRNAGMQIPDHVGATGLGAFAEPELGGLFPVLVEAMPFRANTTRSARFDTSGDRGDDGDGGGGSSGEDDQKGGGWRALSQLVELERYVPGGLERGTKAQRKKE